MWRESLLMTIEDDKFLLLWQSQHTIVMIVAGAAFFGSDDEHRIHRHRKGWQRARGQPC
jgi:hypothetical protein